MSRAEISEPTNEDLLAQLRSGKKEIFGLIVKRFQKEIYTYLVRYLGNEAHAEDVFQNVFLQVYLKINQYDPSRPAKPWVYRIATNQAIDSLRAERKHQKLALNEEPENPRGDALDQLTELLARPTMQNGQPLDVVVLQEKRAKVRQVVELLPLHLKTVIILAYFQGMSYQDIAEVENIPVGTVKSRLHTALLRLYEGLKPTFEDA